MNDASSFIGRPYRSAFLLAALLAGAGGCDPWSPYLQPGGDGGADSQIDMQTGLSDADIPLQKSVINGKIQGATPVASDVAFSTKWPDLPGYGGFYTRVGMADTDDALCYQIMFDRHLKSARSLILEIAVVEEKDPKRVKPASAPGKHSIVQGGGSPGGTKIAFASWEVSSNACPPSTSTLRAIWGSVSVDVVSEDHLIGTFDIVLESGDHLTGAFDAPSCGPAQPSNPSACP